MILATVNRQSSSPAIETRALLDAVEAGKSLSQAEVVHLLQMENKEYVQRLQHLAFERQQSQTPDKKVEFGAGVSLFWTNQCALGPILYPFPKQSNQKGIFRLSKDTLDATLERAKAQHTDRLSLSIGGYCADLVLPGLEAPTLLKTYRKVLNHILEHAPDLRIEGFSPDEVEFLAIVSGHSPRYVLEFLKDHGLTMLGGYGVEILSDSIRNVISPKKATVKTWLGIAKTAYQLSLPMEARIEAGPLESLTQRAQHLEILRTFSQKYPGAFCRLVPQFWTKAPVQTTKTPLRNFNRLSERLKLIALNRLVLGELIPRQQVAWLPNGMNEAQEALMGGASSLGPTDGLAYLQFLLDSREQEFFSIEELQAVATAVSAHHAAGK